VYPIERLGNQLFTYAASFAQARRLGVPCYVNLGFFEHVRPHRPYPYRYELGVFDSGLVVPDDPRMHLPMFLGFPTVPGASFWHDRIGPRLPMSGPPVFMEKGFPYDDAFRRIQPGTTVVGMFQSWRYFDDLGDELRERMTRLTRPSAWFQTMRERIRPGQGQVGIHVRRGDYVLPEVQRKQGLAQRPYYERALTHLRRLGLDGPLWVSTDSLDLVRTEFADLPEFEPIDPPPGVDPFEVVVVMSWLDGLVAANSSFSWWAGYLGARPGQVVIAPRPWFTTAELDTRDLLPANWLTLDRDH
jgi:hypothetical protein